MSRSVSDRKVRFFVTGPYSRSLLLALLLLFSPGAALAQSTDDAAKWGAHVDLEGKLGTKRNLGVGDLFLPFAQNDDTLLFGDIRGRFDDRDNQEGNFGLGLRHMLPSGWNVGGYGYVDRNSTSLGNDFSQLTLGAEALSLDWDVRANVYETVGPSTKNLGAGSSSSTASIVGTSVQVTTVDSQAQEKAMSGFDGEIGWRAPVFAADDTTQLRVYGGGYRFAADNVRTIEGPRGRLDLTIRDVPGLWDGARLDLGAEIQHDGPRGTQAFALVNLRIPLEVFPSRRSAELTPMERRMADPIVRNVDIVSQTHTVTTPVATETATETAGGQSFTVLNSSSTSGAALPGAVAAAGANSTVLLAGTFNTTATTTLQPGQTVAGTLAVKTPSGRTAAVATGATISSNVPDDGTIAMASNSTLTGLTINNTDSIGAISGGSVGVAAFGVSGANILNNTINATETNVTGAAYGVYVVQGGFGFGSPSSNVTVSGNTSTAVGGGVAAAVGVNRSSATVSGNTLSASGAVSWNAAVYLGNATVLAGSSGNTAVAGTCQAFGSIGSSVTFTNAAPCP